MVVNNKINVTKSRVFRDSSGMHGFLVMNVLICLGKYKKLSVAKLEEMEEI